MTDPTFETLEALDAWDWALSNEMTDFLNLGLSSEANILATTIARVRAAHSHLKGHDDDRP